MAAPKRDDKEWENKWRNRQDRLGDNEIHTNGLSSIFDDERYTEIKGALPEALQSLFDDFIKGLMDPKKYRG